ncbi:MAG: alpha/beta hydrolase [Roseovarius sp.]|nr:alpha/beta hydrolase [Roseovarius sp.]
MPRFTTSDGLGLHFEDAGTGAPVLCLAGLTRNGADFTWLAPHVADTRLIRLDYRGRGRSDHAADPQSYSIPREGLDAVELLDHLGLDRAVIIGTSRGGLIAMTLAATHRDRLAGVVLNDIGPELAEAGLARIMDYVGRAPPATDLDAAAEALMQAHAADFPGVPLARWRAQAGFMWFEKPEGGIGLRYDARLREALATPDAGAGAPQPAPDLWPFFDALSDLPLASIRGANSDLFSADCQARMQARNPGMIATAVPDRGHVPFLDEPPALKAIRAVLEAVR